MMRNFDYDIANISHVIIGLMKQMEGIKIGQDIAKFIEANKTSNIKPAVL